MKHWEDRAPEVANLLNPAFCGQIIHRCALSHTRESNETAMPYALAFLVLPLVLHRETRQAMSATRHHFQVWLNANQHIKVGLAERARSIVPYTREALVFLQQTEAMRVRTPDAGLVAAARLRRQPRRRFSAGDETRDCLRKAETLGKWFARASSPATVYASLGLMP